MVDGSCSNRSWRIPVGEFTRSVGRNETFQGVSVMMGVVVFHSVGEAIRQGFQIYDKTADGVYRSDNDNARLGHGAHRPKADG